MMEEKKGPETASIKPATPTPQHLHHVQQMEAELQKLRNQINHQQKIIQQQQHQLQLQQQQPPKQPASQLKFGQINEFNRSRASSDQPEETNDEDDGDEHGKLSGFMTGSANSTIQLDAALCCLGFLFFCLFFVLSNLSK